MEITRRTDYGIRILLELARRGDDCPVSVRELAEIGKVPYQFARAVQRDLVAAELVVSTRGATGGICLARPAAEITLLDVVQALQGEPSCSVCTADPGWCSLMGGCSVHRVWKEADDLVARFLGSKNLGDLVNEERKVR